MVRRISLLIVPVALAGIAFSLPTGCGNNEQLAVPAANASDVAVLVGRVEPEGESFVLRGRVLSVKPVGSASSMAEAGQEIALSPLYPEGRPDPGDASLKKITEIGLRAPGDTVHCRISLDSAGAWRIISAD